MVRRIYSASELTVLHFDCGNDTNGNPRRVYVLMHPLRGFMAAVDEGDSGTDALADLPVTFRFDVGNERVPTTREVVMALRDRIVGRIPTVPSFRREMLSKEARDRYAWSDWVVLLDTPEEEG